jgi:Zn-finger nucleic acid-binding protein
MSKPVYDKPSHNEDEYFARRDAELIQGLRAERDAAMTAAERQSHLMKCPRCGAQLVETERRGIKIESCPECHGMWVDQGEIDLLIKASEAHPTQHMMQHMMQDIISFFHRPNHPNHK